MENQSKVKKSIILSGLVGTGGLFVAKLIGIIYAIPFSSILGNVKYMGYYGQAYNIYSYVLNVFTAGFPFAIATMVSKYTVLDDPKTVLLVKKVSIAMLSLLGFVGMLLLMAFSGVLAPLMVAGDPTIMANVLRILAIALFFVPVLSAFRGYYQGLKEMGEYAFSQAFEQIFRVGFLLSAACLMVYVLHWERKWALYASVLSTTVAAIAGIVQIRHFDKTRSQEIIDQARAQTTPSLKRNEIIKELVLLAIPYLISSLLGYSQQIYNAVLLPAGLKAYYPSEAKVSSIISATTYVGVKMTAIPMVLAPGFTAAIIPHITSALTKHNKRLIQKNVVDCLGVVLYIGLPVSFCLFAYSAPLNYTLFYTDDLNTSTMVLQWLTLESITGTLLPVVTNLMMALKLQPLVLKRMIINAIIKGVLMVPMTMMMGFGGAVLASLIADGYLFFSNLHQIKIHYHISYKRVWQIVFRVCIGLLALWITSMLLTHLGLGSVSSRKIVCFITMCINGLISLIVFMIVTIALKVPELAFHVHIGRPKKEAQ
ncbi:oligosaccharide flippase family protein [Absicoccus porci]|uniref:oligosaccharide flippase family protein n=1 Tax=Absicoccus porci TaxID=2486576 RepID=UPI003F8A9D00